jgi:RNA polymerase sigma factor (sigma-70 family)
MINENVFDKVNKTGWKGYYMYNDEALALIKTWREAEPKYKNKIQYELVRRLSYMVQSKIKVHKNRPFYTDLLQEGKLGLIKALEDFDPLRGLNFFKFASWHIQSRINSHIKWYKRNNREIQKCFESILPESINPHEHYEKKEGDRILLNAIDKLPEIDKQIILMHYGMCGSYHTLEQIGNIFSLSKERIRQIEVRAMSKLRRNREILNFFQ